MNSDEATGILKEFSFSNSKGREEHILYATIASLRLSEVACMNKFPNGKREKNYGLFSFSSDNFYAVLVGLKCFKKCKFHKGRTNLASLCGQFI
ncbi:hypothetical protein CEXT_701731 [Caerostris extrusa]|uniref:LAGLIDADG homing endonuclease n=1 Tax=Caerostris extrusa TaxID=172846 RepID=A0AAV4YCD5_CAEEX|nr:hypothetical protein CEXT_701731 [Caerostris extrusa]